MAYRRPAAVYCTNCNDKNLLTKRVVCGCQYFSTLDTGPLNTFRIVRSSDNCSSEVIPNRENEYELITPIMDNNNGDKRSVSLPPEVKVTHAADHREFKKIDERQDQDKKYLHIPAVDEDENDETDSDDESNSSSDDDPVCEITAKDLQSRLEERFFTSPTPEKEPAGTSSTKKESLVQMQAEKIKEKFKYFREQQAKNSESEKQSPSPSKSIKEKFKINLPDTSKIHLPSFLTTTSRSRSNSVVKDNKEIKTREKSKKKFEFGTYPRVFRKKRKKSLEDDYEQIEAPKKTNTSKPKKSESVPNTPPPSLGRKILNKIKKEIKHNQDDKIQKDLENLKEPSPSINEQIKKSSITISVKNNNEKESKSTTKINETEEKPTKMIIDNKNFFFISLHEDRTDLPPRWNEPKNVDISEDEEKSFSKIIPNTLPKEKKLLKFGNKSSGGGGGESLWSIALRNKENLKITESLAGSKTSKESLSGGFSDSSFQEVTKFENPDPHPESELNVFSKKQDNKEKSDPDPELELKAFSKKPDNKKIIIEKKIINETSKRKKSIPHPEKQIHKTESIPDDKENNIVPEKISMNIAGVKEESIPRREKQILKTESIFDENLVSEKTSLEIARIKNQNFENDCKKRLLRSLDNVSGKDSFEVMDSNPFDDYDSALEKNRRNSDYYSAVEMGRKYSSENSLAQIGFEEPPEPPIRPNRTRSLNRTKKQKIVLLQKCCEEKEDEKQSLQNFQEKEEDVMENKNFNTYPILKPERPRRRFQKRRKYSSSTVASSNPETRYDIDNIDDFNRNIVNSKQLSISFLPLSSNIVNDNLSYYDIRETSSMIHLNITESSKPIPPKRKKSYTLPKSSTAGNRTEKLNFYTNDESSMKTSFLPVSSSLIYSEVSGCEIEYADNSSFNSNKFPEEYEKPPVRPERKHNNSCNTSGRFLSEEYSNQSTDQSTPRSDRSELELERELQREIELELEQDRSMSYEEDNDEQKDLNGYATVGQPSEDVDQYLSRQKVKRTSSNISEKTESSFKNKIRRMSDFFTLPRFTHRENYILPISATLDRKQPPSPSRPPRRRNKMYIELPDQESDQEFCFGNFGHYSQWENIHESTSLTSDDIRYLHSEDILEKMKDRPLPAPPRPVRKNKDDFQEETIIIQTPKMNYEYSQCVKKKNFRETSIERKIINTEMEREPSPTAEMFLEEHTSPDYHRHDVSPSPARHESPEIPARPLKSAIRHTSPESPVRNTYPRRSPSRHKSPKTPDREVKFLEENFETNLKHVRAETLHVSELNVGKLNISEIESSKLLTSNIDSFSMHVSEIQTDSTNCACADEPIIQYICDEECYDTKESFNEARSRISSMIPEVGSDEETTTTTTVKPPLRKRNPNRRSKSRSTSIPDVKENTSRDISPTEGNANRPATLAELTYQILLICQSSIGQAIHALIEQIIPENREKRNEIQAAIWIITIIVAGCLVLGLGSEKAVHHHHWDFHFPPPL